jgi:hypothetical protein
MTHREWDGDEVQRAVAVLNIDDDVDEQSIECFTNYSRWQAIAIRKTYLEHDIEVLRDHNPVTYRRFFCSKGIIPSRTNDKRMVNLLRVLSIAPVVQDAIIGGVLVFITAKE